MRSSKHFWVKDITPVGLGFKLAFRKRMDLDDFPDISHEGVHSGKPTCNMEKIQHFDGIHQKKGGLESSYVSLPES